MSGPAKTGSMIYVNNVKRLTSFYTSMCGLAVIHSTSEIIELGGSIKPEKWESPPFFVSNAVDPEGNVFHIRWARL